MQGDRVQDATIVTIGDSGLPLLNDYPRILEAWGATSVLRRVRGLDEAAVPSRSLVDAHIAAAGSSRGRVAQISSDRDSVQSAFYLISGSPAARETDAPTLSVPATIGS